MQACSGAATTGSLQQPIWTKGLSFHAKGCGSNGFVPQAKLFFVKPCKASYVDGSLVSGKPSSLTAPLPEIGGNYYLP